MTKGRKINTDVRRRLVLEGCVQGMGFRPHIYRLANERALTGFVANSGGTLCIEAQGDRDTVKHFFANVQQQSPAQAVITRCTESKLPCNSEKQFVIRQSPAAICSAQSFSNRVISTNTVSAEARSTANISTQAIPLTDMATCKDCVAEIFDATNRRYQYPFNNCIHCGPRYTIQRTLPYDRVNTSMDGFALCDDCKRDYDDPVNRRFHAQPIACPACGPALSLIDHGTPLPVSSASALISHTVEALNSGAIVALKGVGGFQLVADARDDQAICRLRSRKFRPTKPFAVMMPTTDQLHGHVHVNKTEQTALESPQAPIVLLEKLTTVDVQHRLSQHIAPDNHYLGVMLPYSPLHHLLLAEFNAPLVVTSGNRSGEPLVIDNDAALAQLGDIADIFLLHNRPIVNAVDDSVVQVIENRVQILRLARGYAPFALSGNTLTRDELTDDAFTKNALNEDPGVEDAPTEVAVTNIASSDFAPTKTLLFDIALQETARTSDTQQSVSTLALGGQQKSSVAIATGVHIVSGPYIGDMDTDAARQRYHESLEKFQHLLGVEAHYIACDKHPDYFTSQLATKQSSPIKKIQHHHAHAYACIAEHNLNGPITAIIWDGTGYGDDNQIWGGECFHVNKTTITRCFTLLPFPLPGAEIAVQEPRRSAAGVLFTLFGDALFTQCENLADQFNTNEQPIVLQMLNKTINTPATTSVGRMFDAVASFIGLVQRSEHEGQAPMALEHLAAQSPDYGAYPFTIDKGSNLTAERYSDLGYINWQPMISSIIADINTGTSSSNIAAKFHHTLADLVVTLAKRMGNSQVVLSGGCFQNKFLSERSIRSLRDAGFTPFWHEKIPPNDGGLSFGQAACAASTINSESLSCV